MELKALRTEVAAKEEEAQAKLACAIGHIGVGDLIVSLCRSLRCTRVVRQALRQKVQDAGLKLVTAAGVIDTLSVKVPRFHRGVLQSAVVRSADLRWRQLPGTSMLCSRPLQSRLMLRSQICGSWHDDTPVLQEWWASLHLSLEVGGSYLHKRAFDVVLSSQPLPAAMLSAWHGHQTTNRWCLAYGLMGPVCAI
eukprot:885779-Amphidinium_carterae.1